MLDCERLTWMASLQVGRAVNGALWARGPERATVEPVRESGENPIRPAVLLGGAEGTRTPDPLHAMQVRYQLRHSPIAWTNRTGQPGNPSGPVPRMKIGLGS